MACCSARRTTGRAYEGTGRTLPFLAQLVLWILAVVLGTLGILAVVALCPVSGWARRQRVRFVAAVRDSWKSSGNRMLDTPFLVAPTRRCRWSSTLYRWSRPAAGFAYRYFNVLLASALAGIAALCGVFVRMLVVG